MRKFKTIPEHDTLQPQLNTLLSTLSYSIAGVAYNAGIPHDRVKFLHEHPNNATKKEKNAINTVFYTAREAYVDKVARIKADSVSNLDNYNKQNSITRRANIKMRLPSLRLLLRHRREANEKKLAELKKTRMLALTA
ncbi:hypothetical protein JEZ13_04215 [bacterium]|nr:hypothetical protein [bacterium]MBI9072936.1 hypothetical protein [Melioribacteraceae bacterium]